MEMQVKWRAYACSDLFDRQLHQTITVQDLNGFGMSMWNKKTMGLLKRVSAISQDYYPEMMGKLFVINAPMLFSGIFAIVKNWLDERTKRKITVCRGDYLKVLR